MTAALLIAAALSLLWLGATIAEHKTGPWQDQDSPDASFNVETRERECVEHDGPQNACIQGLLRRASSLASFSGETTITTMTDRDIADLLHTALADVRARGSVRLLDDGRWVVRLMPGQSRQRFAYPPTGQDRDEWLSGITDRLEAAAGVRPEVETFD